MPQREAAFPRLCELASVGRQRLAGDAATCVRAQRRSADRRAHFATPVVLADFALRRLVPLFEPVASADFGGGVRFVERASASSDAAILDSIQASMALESQATARRPKRTAEGKWLAFTSS
jgi:hypothetical protein